MADWRAYLNLVRGRLGQVPAIAWIVAGLIAVSLAVVFALQLSGPPYAALYEGLSPADGGKVIAALQKLGIPYELQGAGNVILVPAPQLAAARLQLGAAQIPQGGADAGWDKLENAPMTASELAQDTMAAQALETSLAQSIETMNGVAAAQVYLALPPDTPFLTDQPKPSASVVITATETAAEAQGAAIANLVAGAVPGLGAAQVTVETTDGVAVYPAPDKSGATSQMATVAQVENAAAARIALLLSPLVGQGNFRTDVSANLDFTQEQIHQVAYGPNQLVQHLVSAESAHAGNEQAAIGVPGALSNEPPAATAAVTPPAPTTPASTSPPSAPPATPGAATSTPGQGLVSKNLDQTYVTDQSDADITNPQWAVKSIAVSVVLNKAALGAVTIDQVKAAIAGAFAYKQVSVNVLAAAFQPPGIPYAARGMMAQDYGALTRAALDVLAAASLLFGFALPLGRRLAGITFTPELAPSVMPRSAPITVLPPPDYSHLRDRASENITSVARLLQSWVEDDG